MGAQDVGVVEAERQESVDSQKDDTGMKDHWKCLAACTLMSMCPFQYGIDFGLISGLQAMDGFLEVFGQLVPNKNPALPPTWVISTERQQLISSLMILGAFISSGFVGPTAKVLSRRISIWVAVVLCYVANILMMTATNIGALYAGRLIVGLSNGMLMTHSQLYIQECAPAKYRGMMISAFQIWTSIGTLIGTIVDNFTAYIDGKNSYIIPLGLIYIVPGFLAIGLFFIPESPRWLMDQGKYDQARKALRWLRPYSDAVVEAEATEIQEALEAEIALNASVGFLDLFRNPIDRRRTLVAVGALSLQGASGAMYMIAYGTYFFQVAGIDKPFQNACILTAVGVFIIIVNSAVITRIGRRRIFLTVGMTICGFAQLFSAIIFTVKPGSQAAGKGIVAFAVIYIVGYNGLVASYAWLSGGELPSQRLRSLTFGVATAMGFLLAWLATFTAPYFINSESLNWGPKYGYIWLPSCLIGAIWTYLYLPEVKGRTLEEIDEMVMLSIETYDDISAVYASYSIF
ncbi:General substrate transporter [Niveomyces insectorum RCEF 264]|uniref:General substrate transporter n=1 Tax=Niveomyces insectorum RCEF 264 TaxID=1081102 RepID=A0A167PWX8_9HYPO|nr:General substrate transporter [Niveomyces insectorum RCEF 264]